MRNEEIIARALCDLDGHPAEVLFGGEPMWRSYLPEALAVVEALGDRLTV